MAGNVYRRGDVLWIWWRDRHGVRQFASTGLRVGEERKARAALRKMEDRAASGLSSTLDSVEAFYSDVWRPFRRAKGNNSQHDEEVRVERHALPHLGAMRLNDVRVHHILEVVAAMQKKGLSPRSIHNVIGVLRLLFRDAKRRDLLDSNPCEDFERGDLPTIRDADPEWREGAVFERHEVEHLCFSPAIPLWRRIDYAVASFTGTRDGERFALRWRHYDAGVQPFGKLAFVASYNEKLGRETETKTKVPRYVPVHPVLAAMLAEWRETGWAAYLGRQPTGEDLLLPFRREVVKRKFLGDRERRTASVAWKYLQEDLQAVGWRGRRAHDFRTTLINLAIEDGAQEGIIRRLTHLKRGEAFDVYKRNRWPVLCREIGKLQLGTFATSEAVTVAVTVPLESAGVEGAASLRHRPPGSDARSGAGLTSSPQPLDPDAAVTNVTETGWHAADTFVLSLLMKEADA